MLSRKWRRLTRRTKFMWWNSFGSNRHIHSGLGILVSTMSLFLNNVHSLNNHKQHRHLNAPVRLPPFWNELSCSMLINYVNGIWFIHCITLNDSSAMIIHDDQYQSAFRVEESLMNCTYSMGSTNSGNQVTVATNFAQAPNTCVFSAWTLLYVTILAPRILCRLLDFSNMFVPLTSKVLEVTPATGMCRSCMPPELFHARDCSPHPHPSAAPFLHRCKGTYAHPAVHSQNKCYRSPKRNHKNRKMIFRNRRSPVRIWAKTSTKLWYSVIFTHSCHENTHSR